MAASATSPNRRVRRWSYRIADVAGIEVRLHVSMLVLFALVLLAADSAESVAGVLGWLALIFLCVLLHEFAHSLVARRAGVAVSEIELLPIGGVSKMDRIPDRPSDELRIALAGPLASMTVGLVALVAAFGAGVNVWPIDLYAGAILPRTGWFNLFVGVFNLLPALPLDGGRVLRALFERKDGPFEATRRAARIGRWLAGALIVIGAYVNLFLLLIGVFVYVTARAEEVATVVHHELQGVSIGEVMVHHPMVLSTANSASEVRRLLPFTAQREFPVVDAAGRYVGMIDARSAGAGDAPLGDILQGLPAVHPDQAVDSAGVLESGSTRAVVDGGHVVGLLRAEDLRLLVDRALSR